MKALGAHVFAGGFTQGVMRVAEVFGQLETHNFGGESVADLNVPFINRDSWEDWPKIGCDLLFGNPRCSGFSCTLSGHGPKSRGPWCEQTIDIHDFCQYTVANDIPIAIWESVQQAYTVGRLLLDRLRDEVFVPAGYRLAHVFMNAASFGNSQERRRYFFVAYKADKNFCITPPVLPKWHATVRDVLGPLLDRSTTEGLMRRGAGYDRDTCSQLGEYDALVAPHLKPGQDLNSFANLNEEFLADNVPFRWEQWVTRTSGIPYGMHCIKRLRWDRQCPSIYSGSDQLIHPELHRSLTIGEIAALMSWGDRIPSGPQPVAQIGKGVCPPVGEWLAQQAKDYVDNKWGDQDWSSAYDHVKGMWCGEHHKDKPVEKVFNLTRYTPNFERTE